MDTLKFNGQLEIDVRRGVVYFHDDQKGFTRLRICGLTIPEGVETMDITHWTGCGQSYTKDETSKSFWGKDVVCPSCGGNHGDCSGQCICT
jgi:hypothetical protein